MPKKLTFDRIWCGMGAILHQLAVEAESQKVILRLATTKQERRGKQPLAGVIANKIQLIFLVAEKQKKMKTQIQI